MPLEIETLVVRTTRFEAIMPGLRFTGPIVEDVLHKTLFPHFNPRFVHFDPITPPGGFDFGYDTTYLTVPATGQPEWTRLEGVRLFQSSINPNPIGHKQWVLSATSRPTWISFEFVVPFRTDQVSLSVGEMLSAEMAEMFTTYAGSSARSARLTKGPGRTYGRIEIVVESEKKRLGALRTLKEYASMPGAFGEAQIQAELDGGELSVVVRDLPRNVSLFTVTHHHVLTL